MHATLPLLEKIPFPAIKRHRLETLQVNLGYRCNQTCLHCHVNAGPKRTEEMSRETIDDLLTFINNNPSIKLLDLTGGAPELNPHFHYFVEQATRSGLQVIDRCNLTILEEPGQEELADFLMKHKVIITASLPCYMEDNVDQQRGNGVFQASIRGLQTLNRLGYAQPGSELTLHLAYNPIEATLPPDQETLELAYKKYLLEHYGIVFNQLFTLANMPIQRFGSTLISKGKFDGYMDTLKASYNHDTLESVMCRSTLSIDWKGHLYDCDFNQMLELPTQLNGHKKTHINEVTAPLENNPITVKGHCYGCTAGQGSSCSGALE